MTSGYDVTMSRAAKERKARLTHLKRVVALCECAWPITVYRNGHGHHPDCPAAVTAARKATA